MFSLTASKRRGDFALDVAIDVTTPGVIALFGRSGCGKTTLVNIIAGLLAPDSARVAIDGVVLEDTQARVCVPAERRHIGYVFQDARLFPHYNVAGNLSYGARRARRYGARGGHDSGAHIEFDKVVELLGLGRFLERRVHELSGGERQRIALGRALLSRPRLLLLDEPLASLDAARREEVLPYLEKLRDEFALPIVYVSHQFDEVLRLATHVVLLDRGRVAAQGTLDEVSLHPELRAIVGSDAIGAVVHGTIELADTESGRAAVRVGGGVLNLSLPNARAGLPVRIQLLARDLILATLPPEGLSVRNALAGTIASIAADEGDTDLVSVDIGGPTVLARVTRAASQALSLRVGLGVWVLVKSVSIRGHAFVAPQTANRCRLF